MTIHVLASGSKGNACLFRIGGKNILVDAGLSLNRLKAGLAAIELTPAALDGVLVTHEHSDHISGLAALIKQYRLPVYARPETWRAMPDSGFPLSDCCRSLGDSLSIGAVKIEPFSLSHDAADPVGYAFYCGQKKMAIMTDTGFVSSSAQAAIAECEALVVEANHDLGMLRRGSYPWPLKRRILSNRGHLANDDTAWLLTRISRRAKMTVILAHLSQENNKPQVATKTVTDILASQNIGVGEDIELCVAEQSRVVSWKAKGG